MTWYNLLKTKDLDLYQGDLDLYQGDLDLYPGDLDLYPGCNMTIHDPAAFHGPKNGFFGSWIRKSDVFRSKDSPPDILMLQKSCMYQVKDVLYQVKDVVSSQGCRIKSRIYPKIPHL